MSGEYGINTNMPKEQDSRFVYVSRCPAGRVLLQGTEERIRYTMEEQCPVCPANRGEEKTVHPVNGHGDWVLICKPRSKFLGIGKERLCGA